MKFLLIAFSFAICRGVDANPFYPPVTLPAVTPQAQGVFDLWTPEHRKAAIPRDYFIDVNDKGKNGHFRDRKLLKEGSYTDTSKPVFLAAGRLYFYMNGIGYVCSGTAVNDGGVSGRSIILTAAHCVYDDTNKRFAYDILFIPNQDDGGTDKTDRNCNNDPMGCWAPSFGVVDNRWASATWPNNIKYDWGYYVVDDVGAHTGTAASNDALDLAVPALAIDFTSTSSSCSGVLMGYSYNRDPDFRYCDVSLVKGSNGWEFPNCGLSGGSSGGPGMFGCNLGNGPLVTVVSWGSGSGRTVKMGGSYLHSNLAQCGFGKAKEQAFNSGLKGIIISGSGTTCTSVTEVV